MTWTHQTYFRRFQLNVEQYGEILVAQIFDGVKLGDAQPCYDIKATGQTVRRQLLAGKASLETVARCLSRTEGDEIRIEVKSKLARGASVVHCSDHKIKGVERLGKRHPPATHFAVILFENDGTAKDAWFFPNDVANGLRRSDTASKYIPVSALRDDAVRESMGVIQIVGLVNEFASTPLQSGP